jgi:putative endopeptidase
MMPKRVPIFTRVVSVLAILGMAALVPRLAQVQDQAAVVPKKVLTLEAVFGALQPPFYEGNLDDAVNFGAIGVVIGHELTHGFDDQGSRYDAEGNLRDWWAADDEKAFKERTDCEVQEYDGFTVAGGEHVNGKLTLGENTADNGGLRIAFAALMKAFASQPESARNPVDGFTPEQRFFLGFGQIWCTNATDQAWRLQVQINPHSPSEFRVNGSVSNFDQFQKAFGCKAGQPMVRANACRVW